MKSMSLIWNELFKKHLRLTEQNKFKLVVSDYTKRWYLDKASDSDLFDGRLMEYAMELQGDEKITGFGENQSYCIGMWYPYAPTQTYCDDDMTIKKITVSPLVEKALGIPILDLSVWKISPMDGEDRYICPAIDGSAVLLTDMHLVLMYTEAPGARSSALRREIIIPNVQCIPDTETKKGITKVERRLHSRGHVEITTYNNNICDIVFHNLSELDTIPELNQKIKALWPPLKRPQKGLWTRTRYPHRAILPTVAMIVFAMVVLLALITIIVVYIKTDGFGRPLGIKDLLRPPAPGTGVIALGSGCRPDGAGVIYKHHNHLLPTLLPK